MDDNGKPTFSPTSLTIADAARLLTRGGGQPVTIEMIESDLAAGAPARTDGTISLICYAAWLVREMPSRD